MCLKIAVLTATLVWMSATTLSGQAPTRSQFRAGAARVDVTPPAAALPKDYLGVLDRIYARAIVLDDGAQRMALITVDAGAIPDPLWRAVTTPVAARLGIPVKNVFITATHSHSVPWNPPIPGLAEKIVASVEQASAQLQPARIGYGSGVSYLNVNRNIIDPRTHRWWEGPNYDGPSDKTVAVITFETTAGAPIAVYYNYAMHAVLAGNLDLVSGDAPGAASRYIEDNFDDRVVALWSEGAAGDQNPVYFNQTYELRDIRTREYAARGIDISNAMPPGGQGLDRANPRVAKLMSQQRQMVQSMGQLLGEEVLHVMRGITATTPAAPLYAEQQTITCPGRERTDSGRAGYAGTYKDAEPIEIRLSLMMIGDVAIGGVNAEVFNLVAQRLKRQSPYARTIMATLTNGSARSGYIPNDAAFGFNTFEVLSSRLKPGCAETAIVDGITGMLPAIQRGSVAGDGTPAGARPAAIPE